MKKGVNVMCVVAFSPISHSRKNKKIDKITLKKHMEQNMEAVKVITFVPFFLTSKGHIKKKGQEFRKKRLFSSNIPVYTCTLKSNFEGPGVKIFSMP